MTVLAFLLACGQGKEGFDPSLLLVGASVGVSPSNAGDGQAAASPGAASGSDLENSANPTGTNPPSGSPASNTQNPANPQIPPTSPSSSAEDSTPPRLLRVEWPADCQTLPSGYYRCDSKPTGPEFIFDEPIDCNSAPQLSGTTILNGGTIKAYSLDTYDFVPGFVSGPRSYSVKGRDQSVAVQAKCTGNRVRIFPVTEEHLGEGKFTAGTWTVVLIGGIKDMAGNVTPDGDSRFTGPVGDVRNPEELGTLFNLNGPGEAPSAYVSSFAVRGFPGSNFLRDFFVMPYIDQKITSNGKLNIMQPSFPVNCENTEEMKKYFSIETINVDDFFQGKPFKPFQITQTTCYSYSGSSFPWVVVDPPMPPGSLIRLRVDGTLRNKQGTMTMGSGKYLELTQIVSGVAQPIPRSTYNLLYNWPENLGKVPECHNLEVEQTVTHFDSNPASMNACGAVKLDTEPLNGSPVHYFYHAGGNVRAIASGVCADYTGPKYLADYPEGMYNVCQDPFPGPGIPASLRPPQDFPFHADAPCESVLPVSEGGKSYIDTGVVGMCIENPGKVNEYVLYYFDYEQKQAARAACKGLWRESGFNYGRRGNLPNETPGTVKKVTTLVCPTADTNAGGATTKPPTGQTCEGRSIEIDTTGGRWFTTPEKTIPVPGQAGKVTKVKGIHTYWQDEPLSIRVKKNCQAGYYKLTFKGMNVDGPLPDFYKAYALTLSNNGEDAGGVVLGASDTVYASSSVTVYLKEGDSTFDVRWKNDAYKKGVYDANFHLNGVTMSYLPDYVPTPRLAKNAREFCDIDGRFFFGTKSAWTPSANQQISYCYPSLPSGKYEVAITARNHGTLPAGYQSFQLNIGGDGVTGSMSIPAASDASKTGKVVLDLTQGDKRLDLKWTNDVYISDDIDSAIEIETIRLRRIGNSERSQLAAFMPQAGKTRNILFVALGMLIVSAAGIFALRIFKKRAQN
ncbi:MAG: hypothetical protein JNM27_02250 [Leptospirales bacterium]|nr:hypothetical protein [Leptospirales bacterium]